MRIKRLRPWLGTYVEVSAEAEGSAGLPGPGEPELLEAIEAAFAEVARIHALMSYHETGSDLSRLNRAASGAWVELDPRTLRVLEFSRELRDLSGGAFHPCARPPAPGLAPPEWDVDLAQGRARRHGPEPLDLGGVAKGFAVDEAARALEAHGLARGWPGLGGSINAGGDLRLVGATETVVRLKCGPEGRPVFRELPLSGARGSARAVATSSVRDATTFVDARAGAYFARARTASVLASECLVADALTKVVLLGDDPSTVARCLRKFSAEALLTDDETGQTQALP